MSKWTFGKAEEKNLLLCVLISVLISPSDSFIIRVLKCIMLKCYDLSGHLHLSSEQDFGLFSLCLLLFSKSAASSQGEEEGQALISSHSLSMTGLKEIV